MKKILISFLLLLSPLSHADGHGFRYYGHPYYHHYEGGWIAPAIIGGIVTYELTRPPAPVIIQQAPQQVYVEKQNCGSWIETQNPDGTITRSRTCTN